MSNNVIKRTWNQNKMVNIEAFSGFAFTAEDGGHTFEISGVNDSGEALALSGTVAGVFRRPDDADVALIGATSDGNAYISLTDACYAVSGHALLTIYITEEGIKTAIYSAYITVVSTSGGGVAGSTQQDVVDLINAIDDAVESIPEDYSALSKDVKDYNSNNRLSGIDWPDHEWNNIVATWNGQKYTVTGTASADTNLNLYSNTMQFPGGIAEGDLLTFDVLNTDSDLKILLFFAINGSYESNGRSLLNGYQVVVPTGATGMLLRFYVASGAAVSATAKISCIKYESNSMIESAMPVILPHPTYYVDGLLQDVLTKYGCAKLIKGNYNIGTVTMPDNSVLTGCGEGSVLQVDAGYDGISVGSNCTLKDLRITCSSGHTGSRGTGSGIVVIGNYENTPFKYNTRIENVTVDGFPCAGIRGVKTGYWVANSISAVNCKFVNCWAGILLEDYCEFNRFTNCLCYNNYIGAMIYSGNNVLVNCSLSNNTVGIYLDGSNENLSGNNGHGAVIGCTINHSGNNSGYAVIAYSITNGFLFDGCHIWYGKVIMNTESGLDDSEGIVFSNCVFGGGTPEIINHGADALFLIGCMFKAQPTFTGAQTTVKNGCYLFDGQAVT